MADESKTGNPKTLERQKAKTEVLETLDADIEPGINVEREEANVAEIAAKAADTGKKKKKRNLWGSVTNRHKNMIKKEEKAAKVAADAEAADLAAKAVAKKLEAEKLEAEKKAQEIQGKATLNAKAYEEKVVKLQLKINIYIEEIDALEEGFAGKLNTTPDETIGELISIEPEDGSVSNSLKIKLRECLKKLGSVMNLRESKQVQRISDYINNLKQTNEIFKINQYLTAGNKLDDKIDFENKKCDPQDSIVECQTKLTQALELFETFKGKMKKAYEDQGTNEGQFKELGKDANKFKEQFVNWMGQLDQLGGEPVTELETLKGKIQGHDINPKLLGDEKDLKSNMLKEIDILIKTIAEFKQYEDELKEANKNKERAKVELEALQKEATAQEVEEAAKKEEDDKELEEFGLGETGADVGQQRGQKDDDGDGQAVVAKTDKPVEGETVEEGEELGDGNKPKNLSTEE
jgi:hypothetical protein